MSWDDPENYEPELDEDHRPGPEDDPSVQELQPQLLALFDADPEQVFYESQLAVQFEDRYFHWVTTRALKDLRVSGRVGSELQELSPNTPLRFYFHRRNRYWKRRAEEVRKLVRLFSDQGLQGLSVFKANCCLTQAFRRLDFNLWDAMSGLGVIVLGHVQGMIWIVFTTAMEFTMGQR